jgi:hypothetical protein
MNLLGERIQLWFHYLSAPSIDKSLEETMQSLSSNILIDFSRYKIGKKESNL